MRSVWSRASRPGRTPSSSGWTWRRAPIPAAALAALDPRPAILTWRSLAEGGSFSGSAEEYRRLVDEAYASGATVDVEHARGLLGDRAAFPERERVVVSLHSPFSLPVRLGGAGSRRCARPARARSSSSRAPPIWPAVCGSRSSSGGRARASRSFRWGPASGPGRVLWRRSSARRSSTVRSSARRRRGRSRSATCCRSTRSTVLDRSRRSSASSPGSTAKSLSPLLHNTLFRARDLPYLYLPLQVADFDREQPHEIAFDPPFRGFAVTQPWKLAAARAGRPSEDVRLIGASNTLVRDRAGVWRAENTDVDGVFDPLADHGTGRGAQRGRHRGGRRGARGRSSPRGGSATRSS